MRIEELVGRRIREVRELQELTQEELGAKLEPLLGKRWPRQTVSAAEKGARAFTAAELLVVAYALNTTVDRLFQPPIELREVELPGGQVLSRDEIAKSALPRFTEVRPLDMAHETLRNLVSTIQGAKDFLEIGTEHAMHLHEALSWAKESGDRSTERPPSAERADE